MPNHHVGYTSTSESHQRRSSNACCTCVGRTHAAQRRLSKAAREAHVPRRSKRSPRRRRTSGAGWVVESGAAMDISEQPEAHVHGCKLAPSRRNHDAAGPGAALAAAAAAAVVVGLPVSTAGKSRPWYATTSAHCCAALLPSPPAAEEEQQPPGAEGEQGDG
eukprot:scaffold2915_cov282-Prasinococcus_capsulatus_cf.AAC.6